MKVLVHLIKSMIRKGVYLNDATTIKTAKYID